MKSISYSHGTRRMDTDPNGYRDFFAKLAEKIPVSVESVRSAFSVILFYL